MTDTFDGVDARDLASCDLEGFSQATGQHVFRSVTTVIVLFSE